MQNYQNHSGGGPLLPAARGRCGQRLALPLGVEGQHGEPAGTEIWVLGLTHIMSHAEPEKCRDVTAETQAGANVRILTTVGTGS